MWNVILKLLHTWNDIPKTLKLSGILILKLIGITILNNICH